MLNILFTAMIGGSALAFGLAFGLGGRDAAQRLIAPGETSLNNTLLPTNTQTTVQQRINSPAQF